MLRTLVFAAARHIARRRLLASSGETAAVGAAALMTSFWRR